MNVLEKFRIAVREFEKDPGCTQWRALKREMIRYQQKTLNNFDVEEVDLSLAEKEYGDD